MALLSKLKPIITALATGVLISAVVFVFLENSKARNLLVFDGFLISSFISLIFLKKDLNEKIALYGLIGITLFAMVTFIIAADITRPIEPFTELYLENYSKVPTSPFGFSFGIVNHEGKQQSYLYRILGYKNNRSTLLNVSVITLIYNETAIIPIKLEKLPNQTSRIAVELFKFGSNGTYRRVHFWLVE